MFTVNVSLLASVVVLMVAVFVTLAVTLAIWGVLFPSNGVSKSSPTSAWKGKDGDVRVLRTRTTPWGKRTVSFYTVRKVGW